MTAPSNTPDILTAKMNAIQEKYAPEMKALEDDGKALEQDGKQQFKLDIRMDWGEQHIKFDVPQFRMTTISLSMDLPQVTLISRDIIFSIPEVKMVTKKIGQYPEFHGLKVVWKDILTDVPEVTMVEQRIVVDIPEIKMTATAISIDVPEVTMKTVEWYVKVPEFRLGDVSAVIPIDNSDIRDRAQTLKARGENLALRMKEEVNTAIQQSQAEASATTGLTAQVAQAAQSTQAKVAQPFDDAVAKIDAALAQAAHLTPDQVQQLNTSKGAVLSAKAKALQESSGILERNLKVSEALTTEA